MKEFSIPGKFSPALFLTRPCGWRRYLIVLPHPERETPEVRRLQPDLATEAIAMRVVMEHERGKGRQVYDVNEKNLGYDITSLDLKSG